MPTLIRRMCSVCGNLFDVDIDVFRSTSTCFDCEKEIEEPVKQDEVACTCESRDLWRYGCQCNYAKRRHR